MLYPVSKLIIMQTLDESESVLEEVELEMPMETEDDDDDQVSMSETKADDPYEFTIDEDATPMMRRSTATPRRLVPKLSTKKAQKKQKVSAKKISSQR